MKLFLASRADGSLDLVLPLLSDKPSNLSLVFITTAANPYPAEKREWVVQNKAKLISMGFNPTDYDLVGKNLTDLRRDLSVFDVICVEGGNIFYLLSEVRKSGFDIVLKELLASGKVYIGSSAGSMLMGPDLKHLLTVDDPSVVPELTDFTSLGYIKERIIPHAGREKYAEKHKQLVAQWGDQLTFLRDDQALVVIGDKIEIVTK